MEWGRVERIKLVKASRIHFEHAELYMTHQMVMFGNQLNMGMGSKEFRAGNNKSEACRFTDSMTTGVDEKNKNKPGYSVARKKCV